MYCFRMLFLVVVYRQWLNDLHCKKMKIPSKCIQSIQKFLNYDSNYGLCLHAMNYDQEAYRGQQSRRLLFIQQTATDEQLNVRWAN